MKKPYGYEETTINTGYTPLEVGGHRLVIMQAKEKLSQSGLKMLEISFDTAPDDKQPSYYRADYEGRKNNPNPKWQGTSYIVLPENYGQTDDRYAWSTRSLKQFITAVEHSQPGWTFDWNIESLKNKRVGGCFGEEEFLSNNGDVLTSVKLRWWCGIDEVPNQKVPNRKELDPAKRPAPESKANDTALPWGNSRVVVSDLPFDL